MKRRRRPTEFSAPRESLYRHLISQIDVEKLADALLRREPSLLQPNRTARRRTDRLQLVAT